MEVGCWAHARRHFHNALEKDQARMGGRAGADRASLRRGEDRTGARCARGGSASAAGRMARADAESLHEYLLTIREQVLPKSEAGQAIAYALKNWTALTRYCADGDLAIDNNGTERSLRGFAVGRNNWTFFGSDNGGKTAAVLRSFVTSCELVKIDPFAWFRDVLDASRNIR